MRRLLLTLLLAHLAAIGIAQMTEFNFSCSATLDPAEGYNIYFCSCEGEDLILTNSSTENGVQISSGLTGMLTLTFEGQTVGSFDCSTLAGGWESFEDIVIDMTSIPISGTEPGYCDNVLQDIFGIVTVSYAPSANELSDPISLSTEIRGHTFSALNLDPGADITICPGETVTLQNFGGDVCNWNIGTTFIASGTSIEVSPTETTTYVVSGDIFTPCGALYSEEITVYVEVAQEWTLGPDIEMCEGHYQMLYGPLGFADYNWQQPSGGPCLQGIENVLLCTDGNFWLTVTDDCGVQSTDHVHVQYVDCSYFDQMVYCPATDLAVPIGMDGPCNPDFIWSASPADPSLIGQETLENPQVSPNVTTVYTMEYLNGAQGCEFTSQEIQVVICCEEPCSIGPGDPVEGQLPTELPCEYLLNGGFEAGAIPNAYGQLDMATDWFITDEDLPCNAAQWNNTPTLYDANVPGSISGIGGTFGSLSPYSGDRFVSLGGNWNSFQNFWGTLSEPLVCGVEYELSFYVAMADPLGPTELGGGDLTFSLYNGDGINLNCSPSKDIFVLTGTYSTSWTHYTGTFILDEDDQAQDFNRLMITAFSPEYWSHAFLDEISISPVRADAGHDQVYCPESDGTVTLGSAADCLGCSFWSSFPVDPSLVGQETSSQPIVSPLVPTTYFLQLLCAEDGCEVESDQVFVDICCAQLTDDHVTLCQGDAHQIQVENFVGDVFGWGPQTDLSSSQVLEPIASPSQTTTYTLHVQTEAFNYCESDILIEVVQPELNYSVSSNLCDLPVEIVNLSQFSDNELNVPNGVQFTQTSQSTFSITNVHPQLIGEGVNVELSAMIDGCPVTETIFIEPCCTGSYYISDLNPEYCPEDNFSLQAGGAEGVYIYANGSLIWSAMDGSSFDWSGTAENFINDFGLNFDNHEITVSLTDLPSSPYCSESETFVVDFKKHCCAPYFLGLNDNVWCLGDDILLEWGGAEIHVITINDVELGYGDWNGLELNMSVDQFMIEYGLDFGDHEIKWFTYSQDGDEDCISEGIYEFTILEECCERIDDCNLVGNGGFEFQPSANDLETFCINCMYGAECFWYDAAGTPDNYNNACQDFDPEEVGDEVENPGFYAPLADDNSIGGGISPFAGDGYASVVAYANWSDCYREYIGQELDAPLETGHCYWVTMQTANQGNRANSAYATIPPQMAFSNSELINPDSGDDFGNPSWDCMTIDPDYLLVGGLNTQYCTEGWTEVSGFYTAQSDETHITIGNFMDDDNSALDFNDDQSCGTTSFSGGPQYARFHIDEVGVFDLLSVSAYTVNACEPVTLGCSSIEGLEYEWTSSVDGVIGTFGTVTDYPAQTTTYTLVVTDLATGNECGGQVTIEVLGGGNLTLDGPTSACSALPAVVTATPGYADYNWQVPAGVTYTTNGNLLTITDIHSSLILSGFELCLEATTDGCGPEACMWFDDCCDAAVELPHFSGLISEIVGSGVSTLSTDFYVPAYSTLTIDVNMVFDNMNIYLDTEANIELMPGVALEVYGTLLDDACGDAWGHLLAPDQSCTLVINNCKIKDSHRGVIVQGGCSVKVEGTLFNRNIRHLKFEDGNFGQVAFDDNRFLCTGGVASNPTGNRTNHAIEIISSRVELAPSIINKVKHAHDGIYARHSEISIKNFEFEEIVRYHPLEHISGKSWCIRSIGIPSEFAPQSRLVVENCLFTESDNGILGRKRNRFVSIKDNFMQGIADQTAVWCNDACLGNEQRSSGIGVRLHQTAKSIVDIVDNRFFDVSHAIRIQESDHVECLIEGNGITITDPSTLHQNEGLRGHGILVENTVMNESFNLEIVENSIYNVWVGIQLENLIADEPASEDLYIAKNDIFLAAPYDQFNCWAPYVGILEIECRGDFVFRNDVSCETGADWRSDGIRIERGGTHHVACNYVHDIGRGFQNIGHCLGEWRLNDMFNCQSGFCYNNAICGIQADLTATAKHSFGNRWFFTVDGVTRPWGAPNHFQFATFGTIFPLENIWVTEPGDDADSGLEWSWEVYPDNILYQDGLPGVELNFINDAQPSLYTCDDYVPVNKARAREKSVNEETIVMEEGLKIAQNPTTGIFDALVTCNDDCNLQLDVYDMVGQLVYSQAVTEGSNQVDIELLPAGLYVVTMKENDRIISSEKVQKL